MAEERRSVEDVLPSEVLLVAFSYLNERELCGSCAGVCHRWKELAESDYLWKELYRRRWRRQRQSKAKQHDEEDEQQLWTSHLASVEGSKGEQVPWKEFYLEQVRSPAQTLLNRIQANPLPFAKLVGMMPEAIEARKLANRMTAEDELVLQLMSLDRSSVLHHALSAFPTSPRQNLLYARDVLNSQILLWRTITSAGMLVPMFVLSVVLQKALPSLYTAPSNYATAPLRLSRLKSFWLFFACSGAYAFLQLLLLGTLPGYKTPSTSYRSLRILCFKFVNQMSTGIVSEVSRWLSCVVSMGFFLLWNFGLKTTFISSGALVIYNALKRWRRGSQTFSEILATAVLVLVAIYQVGSKNILLSLFNWTAMPLFHLLTANAYRSLLVHSPTIPSAFALAVPLLQQRSRQALVDYQGTKNSHLFACAMFFETVVTVLFRIYPLHYRSVRAGSRTTITLSLLSFKEWCKHLLQTYGNESRMEEEEAGEENNSITSRRKLLSRARSCLGATFAVFHFGLLQFYLTNVTMRYGLKTSLAVRCLHELELFAFQLCPTLISFSRRSLTQK
ncbi:F-box/LRR-repeat protein 5, variant 2 [Balamuthia mandrillaris]